MNEDENAKQAVEGLAMLMRGITGNQSLTVPDEVMQKYTESQCGDSIYRSIYEMQMEAKEEADRFIFDTILPYCNEVVRMPISKEELKAALTLWAHVKSCDDVCPCCGTKSTDNINLSPHDFGTLAICAIRYCHGRQSYMPELVRDIVRPYLGRIGDKDLGVMIEDCKHQATFEMYGDEKIDKPGWIEWENQLKAEKERRSNGTSD